MTKLEDLYHRLFMAQAAEADARDAIEIERKRLASLVKTVKNKSSMTLVMSDIRLNAKKNRHNGWDVTTMSRRSVAKDLRCSLYDLKVFLASGQLG